MNEIRKDKHEYFKFIASRRVNRTLEQIRLMKNLSNKNNYAYTDEDINKIFKELRRQIDATEILLKSNLDSKKSFKFTLQ